MCVNCYRSLKITFFDEHSKGNMSFKIRKNDVRAPCGVQEGTPGFPTSFNLSMINIKGLDPAEHLREPTHYIVLQVVFERSLLISYFSKVQKQIVSQYIRPLRRTIIVLRNRAIKPRSKVKVKTMQN